MTPPNPITRIVQMLSALLGGVWAKLFLGRRQAAELQEVMACLKAFDELFARWKAGTLVVPPEPEIEVEYVEAKPRKASARVRTRGPRTRGPLTRDPGAPRNREPAEPPARRRIIRIRPVNWAVIPRRIGPGGKRRKVTVGRMDEWSG